jgi:hypothetical protein
MCVTAKALVVSIWILALAAGPKQSKASDFFEDFSVIEEWNGAPAAVKLTLREEHLLRTTLREAAKQFRTKTETTRRTPTTSTSLGGQLRQFVHIPGTGKS